MRCSLIFFSTFAELEILKDKPDKTKYKKHSDNARMAAFLFVRAKDSWQAINDELGLRPNFDEEISMFLFSFDLMKGKEELMREIAFSESEVQEYFRKKDGDSKIRTLDDEKKSIREVLDLPEK